MCSALSSWLVYALGRAAWGVVPAAAATLVFVFMPIDLAFNNFANLEVPTIFFGLLFTWATLRLWQTWAPRYVTFATLGALGVCQCDWVGIVLIGLVLGFGFVRAYVLPRKWYGRIDERQYARWFAYAMVAMAGTLFLYIYLFGKLDKLNDLVSSYHIRTAGVEDPWKEIFTERRKMWLSWMITPIGGGILAVGIPLSFLRLARRPAEIFPIAWTLAAAFQYLVFKNGADVHIFWPHYFGPCAALSMGVVVACGLWMRRLAVRLSPAVVRSFVGYALGGLLFALSLAPIALLARMAIPQLVQSRKTAGRFDDGGRHINTDADIAQFTEWAVPRLPDGAPLTYQNGFQFSWNGAYAAHRPAHRRQATKSSPGDPDHVALIDTRATSTSDLRAAAKEFAIKAVGPFWRVDTAHGSSLVAIRYTESQPTFLERLFVTGTDLVRTIGPDEDVYASWEWRNALGLNAPTPTAAPGTFDEIRIAHNVAVSRGDPESAAALRTRLLGKAHDLTDIVFTDDVHLLNVDVDDGAATVITLLWETGPKFSPVDDHFGVTCKVTAKPKLWKSETDFFAKDMAPPMAVRPAFWKPGSLYTQRFIALHRIGTEECTGAFSGSEIRPVDGRASIPLPTLP